MAGESGRAAERMGVGVGTGMPETGRHETQFKVEKWDIDQIGWVAAKDYDDMRRLRPGQEPVSHHFRAYRCLPYETYVKEDCNLILDTGWQMIMNGIAGTPPAHVFTNGTYGRIGMGASATAVTYTDTVLGSITSLVGHNWNVINAVPTVGATHALGLVLAAQFITTDLNGGVAIQEFGTDLGTAAALTASPTAPFVSHGNATPGTKTAAQTWNATVTITWLLAREQNQPVSRDNQRAVHPAPARS